MRPPLHPPVLPQAAGSGAGSSLGFENLNANVTDSEIVSSRGFGLKIGSRDVNPSVDPGDFDVLLRGTRFEDNRVADVMVGASNARVDARGNCWLSPEGRKEPTLLTYWIEEATAVDASEPLSCGK